MTSAARILPIATNVDDELAVLDLPGIAWRIRRQRHDKNWFQADVAAACGVTRTTVTNWETSVHPPSLTMCLRLADAFDCTLDWLIRGDVP